MKRIKINNLIKKLDIYLFFLWKTWKRTNFTFLLFFCVLFSIQCLNIFNYYKKTYSIEEKEKEKIASKLITDIITIFNTRENIEKRFLSSTFLEKEIKKLDQNYIVKNTLMGKRIDLVKFLNNSTLLNSLFLNSLGMFTTFSFVKEKKEEAISLIIYFFLFLYMLDSSYRTIVFEGLFRDKEDPELNTFLLRFKTPSNRSTIYINKLLFFFFFNIAKDFLLLNFSSNFIFFSECLKQFLISFNFSYIFYAFLFLFVNNFLLSIGNIAAIPFFYYNGPFSYFFGFIFDSYLFFPKIILTISGLKLYFFIIFYYVISCFILNLITYSKEKKKEY